MEKTTILARMRVTMDFTEAAKHWLHGFPDSWIATEAGSSFLTEYGYTWQRVFSEAADPEVREYFQQLGVPKDSLPHVQVGEHYRGSWVLDAAILMTGTVATAYTVLKGVSELPEIADGLSKLKNRIINRFRPVVERRIREELARFKETLRRESPTSPPPRRLVEVDLVIDARPVLSLTPKLLKGHRLHLSVAISREIFTLENLAEEAMRDVRLGLFRTATERYQWSYQDAYTAEVPLLSGRQTVGKSLDDFRNRAGDRFDLSDGEPVFVDCWIQDKSGIYIFRFYIEGV